MAIFDRPGSEQIYEAARNFRTRCLLADGSMLFEGARVWRLDVLKQLHQLFVAVPDPSEKSFLSKFEGQIGRAGQEVTRLAGELLCVYFLFPANVGGIRKREVVNTVLGWAGDTLPADSLVSKAFEHGIGGAGQGYNTRRPFELAFLIEFMIAWKQFPESDQQAMMEDPWRFKELTGTVEDSKPKQLRQMLLHLLFPLEFERIASSSQKRRILSAYAAVVPGKFDDEDRHLLAIRSALEKIFPGTKLDYYREPLAAAWGAGTDNSLLGAATLEAVQHKKQVVFYGPPGTGKTFTAKALAKNLISAAAMKQWGSSEYFRSQGKLESAFKSNIHRLQLHPAYSYEDFVRGLHIADNGATEYRPGKLLNLIAEMDKTPRNDRLPHVLILDEMNRTDLSRMLGECFSMLEDRDETIELPAHSATGKAMTLRIPDDLYIVGTMNLIDQSVEQLDFALRRRFVWVLSPFDADALLAAAEAKWETADTGTPWNAVAGDFARLAQAATLLNKAIHASPSLGARYEIGHTYLLDVVRFLADAVTRRSKVYLWNQRGEACEPVIQVWQLSLRPLIEQYLSGIGDEARLDELGKLEKLFLKPPMVSE